MLTYANKIYKFYITVSNAPAGVPPKFTAKPSIRQLGTSVVFEVDLLADPVPSIVWYKENTVLNAGGRYTILTRTDGRNYSLLLEISDVTTSDGGTYKVVAKNTLGEANANLTLNLEGMSAFR